MDELNQKMLPADIIRKILDDDFIQSRNRYGNETVEKILSALKQFEHEPLEVEIVERPEFDRRKNNWIVSCKGQSMDYFLTQQEALAWCKKKGLKVKK